MIKFAVISVDSYRFNPYWIFYNCSLKIFAAKESINNLPGSPAPCHLGARQIIYGHSFKPLSHS